MANAQRGLGFNYTLANQICRQATQTKELTVEIKYLFEFDVERVKGIEPSYAAWEAPFRCNTMLQAVTVRDPSRAVADCFEGG
jgi:hypothetical protein